MAAFRLAFELGAPYFELDVHLTADHELVVVHDSSVSRCTGKRGRVENMKLSAIRVLDAGFNFSPDHGRTFPYRGKGLVIPTLEEVLDSFPGTRFTIEIKRTREGIAEALAARIERTGASDRVVVASHEHESISAFRSRAPQVPTSFSKREVRDFLGRCRSGDFEAYRPVGTVFQVPEYHGLRRVVSKPVIELIHRFGIEIHVWTVNEPVHMERLLDWGVDGIMTDDPERAVTTVDRFRDVVSPPR